MGTREVYGANSAATKQMEATVQLCTEKREEIKLLTDSLPSMPEGGEEWAQVVGDITMAYCEADFIKYGMQFAADSRAKCSSEVAQDLDADITDIKETLK